MVASDEKSLLFLVPDREGKNAIEMVQAVDSPFFISMQNDLCIRTGLEYMAVFFEFFTQFDKIIDLAIEDNRHAVIFVCDRLVTALQVNDAETAMSEANLTADIKPFPIRPTMTNGVTDLAERSL